MLNLRATTPSATEPAWGWISLGWRVEPITNQRQRGDDRCGHHLAGVVRAAFVMRQDRASAARRSSRHGRANGQSFDGDSIPADGRSTPRSSRTLGLGRGSSGAHSRPALRLCPVVAFAGSAKPILEQVMGLQLGEHARPLPLAVTEDAGHRNLGVVIQDRLWNPAEDCERPNVAVAEGSVVSAG
jgi:hypothetical protein